VAAAEKQVLAALDDQLMLRLAQEMVRIPDENPPGDVSAMAGYVLSWLKELGVETWTVEPEPGRVNVLARLGARSRPGLVLNGHLDVVPPGDGWSTDPYSGTVRDGKLWGRGSADMKGGVAAILGVVGALVKSKFQLSRSLLVMLTCDEETGGRFGAARLVEEGHVTGDMCIVCEPSGLRLVTAEGGLCWMTLRTYGRAAHSVLAWKGINAVEKMVRVIAALEPLQRELAGLKGSYGKRPVLTANVIRGGTKVNQVPHSCEAFLDLRIPPGLDLSPEEVIARIRRTVAELRQRDPDLRAELEHEEPVRPFEIPPDAPIIGYVKDAYRDVVGQECQYWKPQQDLPSDDSDLYHLWTAGCIPGVYFGPGEIEQAHVADEFVAIEQIFAAARIYALVACRVLG